MRNRAAWAGTALVAIVGAVYFATRGGEREPLPAAPRSEAVAADRSVDSTPSAPPDAASVPPPVPAKWPPATGRLFDAADGTGIAGASVIRITTGWPPAPDRLVATTLEGGEFSIAPDDVAPASYAVRADGYFGVRGVTAAPGDRVEMALARGTTVRARVVELRSRTPIAEADVLVEGRERTRSDPSGRFAFVAGPRTFRVEIEAPGHDEAVFEEIVAPEDGREIEFAIAATEGLLFRVTDAATGKPVERVTIDGEEAELAGGGLVRAAPRARDEVAHAEVAAPGYARKPVSIFVRTQGTPEDPFDVALEPAAAIVGRVVDASGRPIALASVWASGADLGADSVLAPLAAPPAFAETGDDGRFAIEGLSSTAAYALRVTHAAWQPALVENIVFTGPERRTVPDVVLALADKRVGLVRRRDDGSPVAGATIELHHGNGAERATTASDGTFALAVPDESSVLRIRARGLVPATVPLPPGPDDFGEIALETGLAIEGCVIHGDGRPAAGASVSGFLVWLPEDSTGLEEAYAGDGFLDVVADAEGRFRIPGFVPGSRISVFPWLGTLRGVLVSPSVEGAIEAGTTGLVYRLEPAAARSGARVRVVAKSDGRPLTHVGARVASAESSGAPRFETVPGSFTGEIFVPIPPSVAASIVVHTRGFRPETLEPIRVAAGEVREVVAELERAGSISGALFLPDGRAAAGFEISLEPPTNEETGPATQRRTRTRSDGRFSFPGLLDGEHRFAVYSASRGPSGESFLVPVAVRPETIAIADGENVVADVAIQEEPGAAVEGRIELPPGEDAFSKITIRLHAERANGSGPTYSVRLPPNADRYRFDSVAAGTYRVSVDRRSARPGHGESWWNYRASPATVTVPSEGAVTLDIRQRTD